MRVLVTGMGGELGHPRRAAPRGARRGRRDRRRRLRAAAPPAAAQRVQAHRSARPRQARRRSSPTFAPDAVAHFGVYEPDSRHRASATPREYTEACTVAALGAAARAGALERVVVRSGLEVYGRGPRPPARARTRTRRSRPRRRTGARCLEVEAMAADLGRRHGIPVGALRLRAGAGLARPEPARPAAAAARRAGAGARRPAVPAPPPGRRRPRHGRGARCAASTVRSTSSARARRARGRRCGSAAASRSRWSGPAVVGRARGRRARGRAGAAARARAHPARPGRRRRRARVDVLGLGPLRPTQEVCTELYEWGDGHAAAAERNRPHERDGARDDRLEPAVVDRARDAARPGAGTGVAVASMSVRRFRRTRSTVDPFGGDPQLDGPRRDAGISLGVRRPRSSTPSGSRSVGGALLVSNRGLGVVEPAALAVAVRQVVGRRLRVIGAPSVPDRRRLPAQARRARSSHPGDVAALLRAGHVAAAPARR